MARNFKVKVWEKDNGTVNVQEVSVTGEPNETVSHFLCIDDKVLKYEIYDELGQLLDRVDISDVPIGGQESSVGARPASTWQTLTTCCANWILIDDLESILSTSGGVPIIMS